MKIYLAGPISGLSYKEAIEHFISRANRLKRIGYEVMHPMLAKNHLRNDLEFKAEGYTNNPISTNKAILRADFWKTDICDILFVDLTSGKDRVSIGTVAEITRAFTNHKLIITVLPKDNIHNHAFILEMSSIIFETVNDAIDYLIEINE